MRLKKVYDLDWQDFDKGIIKISTDISNGYHCMDVHVWEHPTDVCGFSIKTRQITFTLVKELDDEG